MERCRQWDRRGTGAENRREEMSHITAVNRVLVKILLEQLHSNNVFWLKNGFIVIVILLHRPVLKGLKRNAT